MPNVVIARNTYPDDRALHEVIGELSSQMQHSIEKDFKR